LKGIVLAGGYGTRLMPLTKVTNKHLLPVYDKPMIYYPLQTLIRAGIKKIMIITGPENAGDFMKLLCSGKEFGAEFTYRLQEEAGGIAQALGMAEDFVGDDTCTVILGDNVFEDSIKEHAKKFEKTKGAKLFLKEVEDPRRFGVAVIEGKKLVAIEEKPKAPKSNFAVTGLYMFDSEVFEIIKTLKPSGRGELEISDVNNAYIGKGAMDYSILKGFWGDAGTFSSLFRASEFASGKTKMNK